MNPLRYIFWLVLGTTLLSCNAQDLADLRSTDEGEVVVQPVDITGSFLADFKNTRPRCQFQNSEHLSFAVRCQTVVIDEEDNEVAAFGKADGLDITWHEPTLQEGSESNSIEKVQCKASDDQLSFECDIALAKMDIVTVEFKMSLSKDQQKRDEKDIIVLPYKVSSYGVVPEVMRGFIADSEKDSALNLKQDTARKLGFQAHSMPFETFRTYDDIQDEDLLTCGEVKFYHNNNFIYRIKDDRVSLFAGSPVKSNVDNYSHRLRLSLQSVYRIDCLQDSILVNSARGLLRIYFSHQKVDTILEQIDTYQYWISKNQDKFYYVKDHKVYAKDLKTGKTAGVFVLPAELSYISIQRVQYDGDTTYISVSNQVILKVDETKHVVSLLLQHGISRDFFIDSEANTLTYIKARKLTVRDLKSGAEKTLVEIPSRQECQGLCATPAAWIPSVYYETDNFTVDAATKEVYYPASDVHEIHKIASNGQAQVVVPRDLSQYTWEGDYGRGDSLCYPDDVLVHDGKIFVSDHGHARVLSIDEKQKKITIVRQSSGGFDAYDCEGGYVPPYNQLYVNLEDMLPATTRYYSYSKSKKSKDESLRPLNYFGDITASSFTPAGDILLYDWRAKIVRDDSVEAESDRPYEGVPIEFVRSPEGVLYYVSSPTGSIYGAKHLYRRTNDGEDVAIGRTITHYFTKEKIISKLYLGSCTMMDAIGDKVYYACGTSNPVLYGLVHASEEAQPIVGGGNPNNFTFPSANYYYTKFKFLENGDLLSITRLVSEKQLLVRRYSFKDNKTYDYNPIDVPHVYLKMVHMTRQGEIYFNYNNGIDIWKISLSEGKATLSKTIWRRHANAECGSNVVIQNKATQASLDRKISTDLSKICLGVPRSMDVMDRCHTPEAKKTWFVTHSITPGRSTVVKIEEPCFLGSK